MFYKLIDKMYLNMICFIVSVCQRESCIKSWDGTLFLQILLMQNIKPKRDLFMAKDLMVLM